MSQEHLSSRLATRSGLTLYSLVTKLVVWSMLVTFQTVWAQIRPDKTSGRSQSKLIDTDGIPKYFFEKFFLEMIHRQKLNRKARKISQLAKSSTGLDKQKNLSVKL